MKIILILVVFLLVSCATRTPQTDSLVKDDSFPKKAKITSVPFIKQSDNHCGPATLKMVLDYRGKDVPLSTLTSAAFTPGQEGTFQTDMISSVRRQGMLPVKVTSLPSILKEVDAGNPVIVFQNLGLKSMPEWHYSVVTGYNLKGPDIYLHTGPDKNKKMDMRLFERSWILGDKWSIVIMPPGEISATADDQAMMEAAAGLEQLGEFDKAEMTYQKVLSKWPNSLLALIGMGNIRFQQKKFEASEHYLQAATKLHPTSSMAWHNLATIQGTRGKKADARKSALEALKLADPEVKSSYEKSLRQWL